MQAIVAADVGHLDLAYGYFAETALIDLRDLATSNLNGLQIVAGRAVSRSAHLQG